VGKYHDQIRRTHLSRGDQAQPSRQRLSWLMLPSAGFKDFNTQRTHGPTSTEGRNLPKRTQQFQFFSIEWLFFFVVVIAKYDFPTRAVCIRVEWRAEGWNADNSTILFKTNDSRIYNLSVHRAEKSWMVATYFISEHQQQLVCI
jgi:hypothetical protein